MAASSLKRSALLAMALAASTVPPPSLASAFAPCRQYQVYPTCAFRRQTTPPSSPLLRRLYAAAASAADNSDEISDNSSSVLATPIATTSGSSAVRSIRRDDTPVLPYFQMVSFYRFAPLSDPASVRDALFDELVQIEGLRGTAYLATEGINAQFAIPSESTSDEAVRQSVGQFTAAIRRGMPFDPFEINEINYGDLVDSTLPTFNRLVVRTRDAILRSGLENEDGSSAATTRTAFNWDDAGKELTPEEWDADLRESRSGVLLDCRNSYESDVGTFAGADPLDTDVFSESWDILKAKTKDLDKREPVRIFCTGGIRCVKVGAYLKQELGFEDVRRLEHGIIGYERWAAEEGKRSNDGDSADGDESERKRDSLWVGENFLFDKRRFKEEQEIGTPYH